MEQYPNLPGFYVDLADDGLQILPSVAVTSSVTLIGTAAAGPYFTPIKIGKPEDADMIFGPCERGGVHNGTNLIPAYRQAFGSGCRNITLVRIPHRDYAQVSLNETVGVDPDVTVIPKVIINSLVFDKEAEDTNDIKVQVVENAIKIWNYEDAAGEATDPTFIVEYNEKSTYSHLLKEINEKMKALDCFAELADGVEASDLIALTPDAEAKTAKLALEASAGEYEEGTYEDESGAKTLRNQLKKAYQYLVGYPTDIVVPVGFHLKMDASNVVDDSDVTQLALFCEDANAKESRVIGVISFQPMDTIEAKAISNLVTGLTAETFENIYSSKNGDIGKYVSITIGELLFFDFQLGVYADTAAAAYAGLISTLPPHSSTTNKALPSVRGIRYPFYPAQLDALTGARFVTFRERIGKGIVVTDGVTCAKPASDFTRLTTLRIANSVINVVKHVTEPFIGETMNSSRQDAINTAIDGGLKGLQEAGAVKQYEFVTYFANMQDQVDGVLSVVLSVVPAFEIRKIMLKLTLKPTL